MLQKYNFYRALSWFLQNPTKETGWKELSNNLKLGPPSTKRYIDELKKERIITEKRVGTRKLYSANRESRKYRIFMKFDMVLRMENSGLIDFLNKEYGFPAIIFFGSYCRGEAIEDSDVDIAVITESKKRLDAGQFEKEIRKKIQIFTFSKKEFAQLRKQNESLYDGIINGQVLSGHLEAV